MTNHARIVFQLTKSFFLQEFRSRDSVFWILLFPLFMFILFGVMFGETDVQNGSIIIGVDENLAQSSASFNRFVLPSLRESDTVEMLHLDKEKGLQKLAENQLYAFITGNEEQGAEAGTFVVYVTEKNRPFQTVLSSVLEQSTVASIRRNVSALIPVSEGVKVL